MLSFCPVLQFALMMEVNGTLQGMMCLILVQPDLGTPPQIGIHDPVDHEYGSFDATDFAQGRETRPVFARSGSA